MERGNVAAIVLASALVGVVLGVALGESGLAQGERTSYFATTVPATSIVRSYVNSTQTV